MKTLLIAAISIYLALCAFMYFAQRGLMYFPDRTRTAPADAGLPEAKEEKLATADGETIIVWHIPPRDAQKPVVIYFHGNGGALNLRARRFASLVPTERRCDDVPRRSTSAQRGGSARAHGGVR